MKVRSPEDRKPIKLYEPCFSLSISPAVFRYYSQLTVRSRVISIDAIRQRIQLMLYILDLLVRACLPSDKA